MANITIPPGLQAAGSGLATEVTLTATNTKLDTLIAQTDTLEVSVGDVDVNTDGLETLATATNTKLDTIITQTDTIETVLMSIDDGLPNALGRQAAAASTGVALSTEDKASLDAVGTKLDSLITKTAGSLVPFAHDYISYTSGATTDTYVYKIGGSGGTTVATVVLTYTGTDKATLADVVRT